MKRTAFLAAVLTVIWCCSTLMAQQTPKSNAAKRRIVTTDAEMVRNKPLPSGQNFTTLSGGVVIVSEDSVLHTEKATYDGDTQIANSPTKLRIDDKQNTITGDKGVAYYSTRDAEITGNVVINARPNSNDSANAPKNSARRNFKDPVTITCDKAVYNWSSKKAVLTGHLTIKQKDRVVTGERGLYDGNTEIATLVGNIKSRRPNGETGDAPGSEARAIVSFKEGDEYVEVYKDKNNEKIHTVVPLKDKGNGDVDYDDSPATTTPNVPAPRTTPPTPPGTTLPAPGSSPAAPTSDTPSNPTPPNGTPTNGTPPQ